MENNETVRQAAMRLLSQEVMILEALIGYSAMLMDYSEAIGIGGKDHEKASQAFAQVFESRCEMLSKQIGKDLRQLRQSAMSSAIERCMSVDRDDTIDVVL